MNGFSPDVMVSTATPLPAMPPLHSQSFSAAPMLSPQSIPDSPMIMTVIPAEGPMAGGTTVAIIGDRFTPDLIMLFGGRPARLERVSPTFIQCLSPAASSAGLVNVTIQGSPATSGSPPCRFKYNEMDADL